MLCFRCEHRARFLEAVAKGEHPPRPRHECGEAGQSKWGCYMFMPCLPILVSKDKNDPRAAFDAPMIAARVHATRVMEPEEVKLGIVCENKEGFAVGWKMKP